MIYYSNVVYRISIEFHNGIISIFVNEKRIYSNECSNSIFIDVVNEWEIVGPMKLKTTPLNLLIERVLGEYNWSNFLAIYGEDSCER